MEEHTEHLKPFQCCHTQDKVLFRQVEDLNVSRDVSDNGFRLGSLFSDEGHLTQKILVHNKK